MTKYNASDAQQHLFQLLDAVQEGQEVIVERKGIRFKVILENLKSSQHIHSPLLIEDHDVLSGNWTWTSDLQGNLEFHRREEND